VKFTLVAIAVLLLIGCVRAPVGAERATAAPLNAQCAPTCGARCTPDTWPLWQGDAADPTTWDELGPLIDALKAIGERCEHARFACAQCLRRLEQVNAICGFQHACVESRR